jgi:hypothetical protein
MRYCLEFARSRCGKSWRTWGRMAGLRVLWYMSYSEGLQIDSPNWYCSQRLDRKNDYSHASSTEVMNAWSFTSASHIRLLNSMLAHKFSFAFIHGHEDQWGVANRRVYLPGVRHDGLLLECCRLDKKRCNKEQQNSRWNGRQFIVRERRASFYYKVRRLRPLVSSLWQGQYGSEDVRIGRSGCVKEGLRNSGFRN